MPKTMLLVGAILVLISFGASIFVSKNRLVSVGRYFAAAFLAVSCVGLFDLAGPEDDRWKIALSIAAVLVCLGTYKLFRRTKKDSSVSL